MVVADRKRMRENARSISLMLLRRALRAGDAKRAERLRAKLEEVKGS